MKRNFRKVFRFYTPATVNRVERWLTEMSQNGWSLVDVNGWYFVFLPIEPREKYFFMYIQPDASKGFSRDYHEVERKYRKKKSVLKSLLVVEIDPQKIDADYCRFKVSRNKSYLHRYLRMTILSLVFLVVSGVGMCIGATILIAFLFWLMMFLYAISSFFTIKRDMFLH